MGAKIARFVSFCLRLTTTDFADFTDLLCLIRVICGYFYCTLRGDEQPTHTQRQTTTLILYSWQKARNCFA